MSRNRKYDCSKWIEENTNKHFCECGCGKYVKPNEDRYYGKDKQWFINLHQNRGKNHPKYKGGVILAKGYVWYAYDGEHPRKTPRGYVKRCWLVIEKKLGRLLKPDEIVHHINHNKLDDRLENLTILTRTQHSRLHSTGIANSSYRSDVDAELHVLPLALKGFSTRQLVQRFQCSKPTINRRLRYLREKGLLPTP